MNLQNIEQKFVSKIQLTIERSFDLLCLVSSQRSTLLVAVFKGKQFGLIWAKAKQHYVRSGIAPDFASTSALWSIVHNANWNWEWFLDVCTLHLWLWVGSLNYSCIVFCRPRFHTKPFDISPDLTGRDSCVLSATFPSSLELLKSGLVSSKLGNSMLSIASFVMEVWLVTIASKEMS